MSEEEKAAAETKRKAIDEAKKRSAEKAKLTKSMIIMDVKPWDDTTDMSKLEEEVRSIKKDGLLWGSCESWARATGYPGVGGGATGQPLVC